MKRKVRLAGNEGVLDLQASNGKVEGVFQWTGEAAREYSLSVSSVEPGVYSVLRGTRAWEVRVSHSHEGWVVEIGGNRFVLEVEDPREVSSREKRFGSQGRQNIVASMPGKVVRVLVEEGAAVTEGQGLVVVEAMKMQNEMKSPKAGKVLALAVRAGASVTAGQVLVTLE